MLKRAVIQRLHGMYFMLRERCYNPENTSYHIHGKRGIKICEEWQSSHNFISWSKSNGYKSGVYLARYDLDKDFSPSNCYWSPKRQYTQIAKGVRIRKNIRNEGRTEREKRDWRTICAAWHNMHYRCYNPKCDRYYTYGALGIKVCSEWQEFRPFYDWSIANGYRRGLTIHRKDNEKGYNPNNCTWTDDDVQNNNKRNSRFIEWNGERKTVTQWASELNMKWACINDRLRRGWSVEETLTTPSRPHRKAKCINRRVDRAPLLIFGKTFKEWSEALGLSRYVLMQRWYRYKCHTFEEFTRPKGTHKKWLLNPRRE